MSNDPFFSYSLPRLADHIQSILRKRERELRVEQAVYGLDSLDELELHPLLANGLSRYFAVAREVHYPSTVGRKLSHRPRCDLVLAPRGRPLQLDSAPPTLFDPPRQTKPQDALWLEIKSAFQFRSPGVRHDGYSHQWRDAIVDDLRKMEADALIRHAALLLIVFVESADILEKDLELLEAILIRREVLAGGRQVRQIPILDRMGHALCAVSLWPTLRR